MKKEQWIKKADIAHNDVADSLFCIQNYVSLLEIAVEKGELEDSVVFTSRRDNEEVHLSKIIQILDRMISKCSRAHSTFAELSKGLLQVVSDDTNVEPKSLFE